MVIIPLPNVRSREVTEINGQLDTNYRIRPLPCDMAVMVCDPEWQIKTGIEIVLFIQRPGEGFSDLLQRWRQTKAELGQGVEWMMPRQHRHLLSEGTETPHPLFVVFTPGQPQPTNEAIAANQATHSPIEATPTTETQTTEVKTAEIKTAKTTETTGIHPIVTLEHRSANIIHGLTGAQLPIAIQPLTP